VNSRTIGTSENHSATGKNYCMMIEKFGTSEVSLLLFFTAEPDDCAIEIGKKILLKSLPEQKIKA
jgi:hypothetical protein